MDFSRLKVVLFDADDTLRRCTVPGQNCPYNEGEWELIPGTEEYIRELQRSHPHLRFGIVSNQGGIASGKVKQRVAAALLRVLLTQLFGEAGWEGFYCEHASTGNCLCRKPSPYMLLQAAARLGDLLSDTLQRDEVLYVGDLPTDKQAAEAAGFHFQWADEFFPGRPKGPRSPG